MDLSEYDEKFLELAKNIPWGKLTSNSSQPQQTQDFLKELRNAKKRLEKIQTERETERVRGLLTLNQA